MGLYLVVSRWSYFVWSLDVLCFVVHLWCYFLLSLDSAILYGPSMMHFEWCPDCNSFMVLRYVISYGISI